MWKPLLPVLALAVFLAACSQTGSDPAELGSTIDPTTSPVTGSVDTVQEVEASPDGGDTESAGAAFDEAGLSLGPGRAFPALDDPPMVPAASAVWLDPDDLVLGILAGDEAHAFPASQLAYHHIVNTTIAGEPYLVTY